MRISIIIFSCALLFNTKLCFSQSNSTPVPQLDKSIIQPSPDAAAFAKYGSHPVTLYAGKTSTSIPIFDIKQPKIGISVSLGYNYAGYKPAEVASNVGLGWDLQAGGVITRQVKDKPDEQADSTWASFPDLHMYVDNQKFMRNASNDVGGKWDTEPDIYNFNVAGYSGKFILIKERAFLIPQQDIQITLNVAGNFRMVTPDGTVYEFNDKENTEILAHSGGAATEYVSAWNLTRIRSNDLTDIIEYFYTNWTYQSGVYDISESYKKKRGRASSNICNGSNNGCDEWVKTPFNGTTIAAKRISMILGKQVKIEFLQATTGREDITNNNTAFALSEIKISNRTTNKLLKKVKLLHNYFIDGAINKTKLKLSAVEVIGYYNAPNNTSPDLRPEKYVFEYNNEVSGDFPKYTRGIDRWGYYNGANGNYTLFNAEILATPYSPALGESNRNVNVDKVKNGILTKITYPSNGYSLFDYEINKINPNSSSNEEYDDNTEIKNCVNDYTPPALATCADANGINIPLVNGNNQEVNILVKRSLFYNNQGSAYNAIPLLEIFVSTNSSTPVYSLPLFGLTQTSMNVSVTLPPGLYYFNSKCEANAISTSVEIGYKKVRPQVVIDGPGLRIKNIKTFDNINATTPAFEKYFEYPLAAKSNMVHQGGKFENTVYFSDCSSCNDYEGHDDTYSANIGTTLPPHLSELFYYDEVIEKNIATNANGKTLYKYNSQNFSQHGPDLVEQIIFDNNDNPLSKVKNTYTLVGGNKSYYTAPLSLAWYLIPNCNTSIPNVCNPYISAVETDITNKAYKLSPSLITSYHNVLTNKKEYQYQGLNELVTNTDYYYDNPNHTMPTKVVTKNSKDEEIITETKYPIDYTALSDCGTDASDYTAFNNSRNTILQQATTAIANRYAYALTLVNGSSNTTNTALINYMNDPANNFEGIARSQFSTTLNTHANFPITSAICLISKLDLPPAPYINSFNAPLFLMQSKNIINKPGEQMSYLKKPDGSEYLQNAVKYFYYTNNYLPETIQSTPVNPQTVTKASFLANSANYYKDKIKFKYTTLGQIQNQNVINNLKTNYIYGYNNLYPIAEVVNAEIQHAAYTSFEEPLSTYSTWGIGKWLVTGGTLNTALRFIGKNSFVFNTYNSVPATVESDDIGIGTFTVSFWKYGTQAITVKNELGIAATPTTGITKNGWTYYEYSLTNPSRVIVESSSATIDELRLYPSNALMTNYCYEPLIGVTAKITPTNQLLKYVYDGFGRLTLIRDIDDNVVKKFCYNLAGQVEDCNTISCEGASETPNWQNTAYTECEVNGYGVNTGVVLQQQQDMNPCSATGGQYQMIQAGTNTTTCPIPPYINLTSTNTYGTTGYLAKYTPILFFGTPGNGDPYYFNVPATTGVQPLGSVPEGTYFVEIYRTTAPPLAIFTGGCATPIVTGTVATFYNVNVTNCNSISITLEN